MSEKSYILVIFNRSEGQSSSIVNVKSSDEFNVDLYVKVMNEYLDEDMSLEDYQENSKIYKKKKFISQDEEEESYMLIPVN